MFSSLLLGQNSRARANTSEVSWCCTPVSLWTRSHQEAGGGEAPGNSPIMLRGTFLPQSGLLCHVWTTRSEHPLWLLKSPLAQKVPFRPTVLSGTIFVSCCFGALCALLGSHREHGNGHYRSSILPLPKLLIQLGNRKWILLWNVGCLLLGATPGSCIPRWPGMHYL